MIALLAAAVIAGLLLASPALKRHRQSTQCANTMTSLACAGRLWVDEHEGRWPTDLRSLSNEVGMLKLLICPGDQSRQAAVTWGSLTTNQTSYELLVPAKPDGGTNQVLLRCKIHGHVAYPDGTVFDGTRRRAKTL